MHTRVTFLKHHYLYLPLSWEYTGDICWDIVIHSMFYITLNIHIVCFEYHGDRTLIESGSSGIYLEYYGTYLVDIGELTNNRLPSGKLT